LYLVQAEDGDMRDFRDAESMAHTLRVVLAAKGIRITNSQSLELIAQAFGVADWNTLPAAIRGEAQARADLSRPTAAQDVPVLPFSAQLPVTMHRALTYASERKHQYATLEHFQLALIDDPDARSVLKACNADFDSLTKKPVGHIDGELQKLITDDGEDCKPTAAFLRVIQRAGLQAKGRGRPMVTGADTLVAMLTETASPAARFLGEQGVSRESVANLDEWRVIVGGGTRET
jgi:hypothetical protein